MRKTTTVSMPAAEAGARPPLPDLAATDRPVPHPTLHFGCGTGARLWAACRNRERIVIEFVDGATLVGTVEPAPLGADLVLLSPRRGCPPIAVSTTCITYVGPASALAP